jgi:hypothetical protein
MILFQAVERLMAAIRARAPVRHARVRGGADLRLRALLALAACCLVVPAFAQTSAVRHAGASEDNVKAAYLLKFLNYIAWPAASFGTPGSPYVIGVFNDDEVFAELQRQVVGRSFNGRPVVLRRIGGSDQENGIHVLFVGSRTDAARQAALMRQLKDEPVLTVTEQDGALDQGSMINFRLVDDRVRFEVALDPVKRAGLELNSRLLSVAIAVNKGAQP